MPIIIENIPDLYRLYDSHHLTIEPHVHRHIEIIFAKSCEKSVGFCGNKSAIIETGDLFITFPQQVHYYTDLVPRLEANVLLISADLCPEYNNIFKNFILESPIIKNATSYPILINSLFAICERIQNGTENKNFIRGCILVLLSEVFNISQLEKLPMQAPNIAQKIINYCHQHYTSNISLQDIADEFNLNRCYVSQIFNRQLNVNFSEYINSLRMHTACELLESTTKPITEICYEVGFNTLRTFNRLFQKIHNTTPHKYRTQILEKRNNQAEN